MTVPKSTSRLSTVAAPTSFPPVTSVATAGIPFFFSTSETIFVTAMEHRGVLGEGFHKVALPAANDNARFLDNDLKQLFCA